MFSFESGKFSARFASARAHVFDHPQENLAMKTWLLIAIATLALACVPASRTAVTTAAVTTAQERFEGQWLVEYRPDEQGRIQLTLNYQERREAKDGSKGSGYSNWNSSFRIEPEKLEGLGREQVMSASGTNVRFQLRRDAGALECEGWFREGKGSGHYRFVPNPNFAAELRSRGINGDPTARQLFRMALADAGLALVDELKAQGYETPTFDQLIKMGDHGVRLDYVRGLKEYGYKLGSIDALVKMRDHGVTTSYIKEMRDFGFKNLTAEELVRARDPGVSASFINELEAAGYMNAADSLDGLIRLRDHGVSGSFIREVREEGYTQLPLEQLVRMKDHGVSTNFIKELKALGYANLTVDQLVRLKDHGVNARFISRVKTERGTNPSVEELIRLRNQGYDE
ncbi:MAG TPA: hypothetical protein VF064_11700 [Pyrinomonadaceae bacterium]